MKAKRKDTPSKNKEVDRLARMLNEMRDRAFSTPKEMATAMPTALRLLAEAVWKRV
jgi:hypothetical protein